MTYEYDYRMIPTKPDLFKELEQVKGEAEQEIGTKIDWNGFLWGAVLGGLAGTAAGLAIAKAVKRSKAKEKKRKKEVKSNAQPK